MKTFIEGELLSRDAEGFKLRDEAGVVHAVAYRNPGRDIMAHPGDQLSVVAEVGDGGGLLADSVLLLKEGGAAFNAERPVMPGPPPFDAQPFANADIPTPRPRPKPLAIIAGVLGAVVVIAIGVVMTDAGRGRGAGGRADAADGPDPKDAPYTQYPQQFGDTLPRGQADGQMEGPPGMRPVPSPVGQVFTAALNLGSGVSGSGPTASKLGETFLHDVSGYFDAPPSVVATQTDPQERFSQTAFNATLRGAPVSGVYAVRSDSGGGTIVLMYDLSGRIQQTLPVMMQAAQQASGQAPE